jgi:hypothetical protein
MAFSYAKGVRFTVEFVGIDVSRENILLSFCKDIKHNLSLMMKETISHYC